MQAPLTLAYASPEALRSKLGDKCDQYSLAISYIELRTGHLPFDEDAAAIDVMQGARAGATQFVASDPRRS